MSISHKNSKNMIKVDSEIHCYITSLKNILNIYKNLNYSTFIFDIVKKINSIDKFLLVEIESLFNYLIRNNIFTKENLNLKLLNIISDLRSQDNYILYKHNNIPLTLNELIEDESRWQALIKAKNKDSDLNKIILKNLTSYIKLRKTFINSHLPDIMNILENLI